MRTAIESVETTSIRHDDAQSVSQYTDQTVLARQRSTPLTFDKLRSRELGEDRRVEDEVDGW